MVSMEPKINIAYEAIRAFCDRYHIRKLALFGSVLSENFTHESDVDVLVEFEPEARVGWEIVSIEDELSEILKRKADLNTPGDLSRHFRQQVVDTAEVIYERAG
jgi:predicted nucleotidyltransferase